MRFRAIIEVIRVAIADRFAQALQPHARPGEFDAEDRKAYRNHYDSGAGRHDHDDADQQNRGADHPNGDATSGFIR